MFVEESLWIRDALSKFSLGAGIHILDVGASSNEFRLNVQPHITSNVHAPLLARGCALTLADIKQEEGIDLVLDLTATDIDSKIYERKYDVVICCNVLEHVVDRDHFLRNLGRFVRAGSMIVVTVPRKYPKHDDPIDTMYRPTPMELVSSIKMHIPISLLISGIVTVTEKQYYIRARGRLLDYLFPFRATANLWRYYLTPFRWQVSCVLARVTD